MTIRSFQSIPVLDVGAAEGPPAERAQLAEQICRISHEVGFFIVINHGINRSLVEDVFSTMRSFFSRPEHERALIDKRMSRHFRGWEAEGAELTNNRPDIRQQIDLWSEWPALPADVEPAHLRLLGPNQWMPEEILPGHRAVVLEWMTELGSLADQLLALISVGLGLDDQHFARFFGAQPMSLTKLISYPPTPAGGAGVNAHHDTGFVTILAAGETPGLQVQNPEGQWIEVPPHADGFVVNLGEMLQAMTGNYFVATPHRVITETARLSAAYFHGPSLEATLDPLPLDPAFAEAVAASPRHAAAGFMAAAEETDAGVGDMKAERRASTYGEQLWNYFARSYPANMARHYGPP